MLSGTIEWEWLLANPHGFATISILMDARGGVVPEMWLFQGNRRERSSHFSRRILSASNTIKAIEPSGCIGAPWIQERASRVGR